MTGEELFARTLPKVAAAFRSSDVKRLQERLGQDWYYELCFLPLVPQQPLLLGLNPGRDPAGHTPQTQYPTDARYAEVMNWRFVNRSLKWITRHLGSVRDLNYFNVCPFRSQSLADLTDRDWRLGIESFFLDVIDFVAPSKVAVLGTSGVHRLEAMNLTKSRDIGIVSKEGRRINARVGVVLGREGSYPFFAVPSPNNALSDADRDAIWRLASSRV